MWSSRSVSRFAGSACRRAVSANQRRTLLETPGVKGLFLVGLALLCYREASPERNSDPAPPPEVRAVALREQIHAAIRKGSGFLRDRFVSLFFRKEELKRQLDELDRKCRNWNEMSLSEQAAYKKVRDDYLTLANRGIQSQDLSLITYALLETGASEEEAVVRKSLDHVADYLRSTDGMTTEAVSYGILAILTSWKTGYGKGRVDAVAAGVRKLSEGQWESGMWGPECKPTRGIRQLPNEGLMRETAAALDALHAAVVNGIPVPKEIWQKTLSHYKAAYDEAGRFDWTPGGCRLEPHLKAWNYEAPPPSDSLVCLSLMLDVLRCQAVLEGKPKDPFKLEALAGAESTLAKLSEDFLGKYGEDHMDSYRALFRELLQLENLAVFSRRRKLAGHDWYERGARYIVARQQTDGSWRNEYSEAYDTSNALLYLKRIGTYTYDIGEMRYEVGPQDPDARP